MVVIDIIALDANGLLPIACVDNVVRIAQNTLNILKVDTNSSFHRGVRSVESHLGSRSRTANKNSIFGNCPAFETVARDDSNFSPFEGEFWRIAVVGMQAKIIDITCVLAGGQGNDRNLPTVKEHEGMMYRIEADQFGVGG